MLVGHETSDYSTEGTTITSGVRWNYGGEVGMFNLSPGALADIQSSVKSIMSLGSM